MFTTFQTTSGGFSPGGSPSGESSKSGRPAGSRRITTTNACVECRRRKIRCDGLQPCGQCQWYQHPEACTYAKPVARVVPSRKLVERLTSSVEQHQMVLSRLFGSKDVESLLSLPREELLNLALSKSTNDSPITATEHASGQEEQQPRSDGAESLHLLEEAPESIKEWHEDSKEPLQSAEDVVNSLSMRVDRQTSYVGVSSVNAALKVIYKRAPNSRTVIKNHGSAEKQAMQTPPQMFPQDAGILPSRQEAQRLVTAYFEQVHPFFPMIDEESFYNDFNTGRRKDPPWMGLMNMVFALGALASGTTDNEDHTIYYKRAQDWTTPKLLALRNPSIESLHVLSMSGGYYLHYLNRPNEGDLTMGAALRIACALGLHREYISHEASDQSTSSGSTEFGEASTSRTAEIRRRTWWSMFCLDTWAHTTTGRPSLGRLSKGVTVLEPGKFTNFSTMPDLDRLKLLPLIHNIDFCKIATMIEDRLAATPLIPFDEVVQLDASLVRWWEELPSMLRKDPEESIPSFLRVPRKVMKWWWQNQRIILHRPYLLSAALRKLPFSSLSAEEKLAISKCRLVAAKTIDDICAECKNNVISGWNGVWHAYQAAFVPLVSLFTDFTSADDSERWRGQVNKAIAFFARMEKYAVSAKSSQENLTKLLIAAKAASGAENAQRRQQQALKKAMAQRQERDKPGLNRSSGLQSIQPHPAHQHPRITSHPLQMNNLMMHNIKTESLHSQHSSPIDHMSDEMSPASYASMGGGLHTPAHSASGQMGHMSQMTSPANYMGFGHPQMLGSPSVDHHMGMHMQQSPASQGGFWDDMMWDTYSDVDSMNQAFIPQGDSTQGWGHGEASGSGTTDQWQYGTQNAPWSQG